MIVYVSFYDVTRDAVHSEGTSIGMGDIYRLGDAVMAATNIKARHAHTYFFFTIVIIACRIFSSH